MKKPKILVKYNNWVMSWTKRSEAERALYFLSFAESSFFPIPIDPLLAAVVSSKPQHAKRIVLLSSVASILGGLLGFVIGALLMETLGQWVLDTYSLQEQFNSLGASYQDNAFLAVLAAAFTPIPYKIITISAGAFSINIWAFILASIIGRAGRYSLVGWFSSIVGAKYKDKIEYYINLLTLAVIGLIVIVILGLNI